MSAANWRRMMVTGALPGRNPGIRATRAISRAAFSLALVTFAAGISSSISRLQVASVIGIFSGLHRRGKAELQLALVCLSPVHIARRKRQGSGAADLHRVKLKYKQCMLRRQRRCGDTKSFLPLILPVE